MTPYSHTSQGMTPHASTPRFNPVEAPSEPPEPWHGHQGSLDQGGGAGRRRSACGFGIAVTRDWVPAQAVWVRCLPIVANVRRHATNGAFDLSLHRDSCAARSGGPPATVSCSSLGEDQKPTPSPARYAAPSAVVSVIFGRTTGTPSRSAWKLHQQIVRGGAAVDSKLDERARRILLHRCEKLGALETRWLRARRARCAHE